MVQLEILTGNTAGTRWATRRFPVQIGRNAESDLQLEEQGVWDHHVQISLNPAVGFILETQPQALVVANGQPVERLVLRNGDTIEIGAVKLRFWLSEPRQSRLRLQEFFVWTVVFGVTLGQVALIYWL